MQTVWYNRLLPGRHMLAGLQVGTQTKWRYKARDYTYLV